MRSHSDLEAAIGEFPRLLNELVAGEVFGRGAGRTAPPRQKGIYLFTELGRHLYTGRVAITERAKARGSEGWSNFRTRLAAHTRPSSGQTSASFAFRLAVEAVGDSIENLPTTRAAREAHEDFARVFAEQKERVTATDFRVVRIDDEFANYVFEPYAAFRLETPYNSWATS